MTGTDTRNLQFFLQDYQCYCLRHGLHIRENLRFLNTGMEFSKNLYASVLKAPSRN